MDFQREQQKFLCSGIDIVHAADLMPPGKFPFLENARQYSAGQLAPRAGLTKVNSSALSSTNITSVGRMNDYVFGDFLRFIGAGTALFSGKTSFSSIDTGYSGDPMSFIPYRPEETNNVWTYIANYNKMRKVDINSTVRNVGITPPTAVPDMILEPPKYTHFVPMRYPTSWTNQGTAGSVSSTGRLTGVVIDQIVYFSGTTGWAVIGPDTGNYQDIAPGMHIIINSGGGTAEHTIVEEVHKVNNGASGNTIAAILYDSGTTGLCTIQPSLPLTGITRNTGLILGGSSPEYVRVISVTDGPGGIASFRCSTVATHAATDSITQSDGGSFVVYCINNHSAGESLTTDKLDCSISAGSGSVAYNGGAGMLNFADAGSRPTSPDDYIHLSIKVDNPNNIIEGTLVLDVDKNTTSSYASTDGNRNAFVRAFRPNDFQALVQGAQPSDAIRARAIQLQVQNNTQVDLQSGLNPSAPYGTGQDSTPLDVPAGESAPPIPLDAAPASQMVLGDSQWTEFLWKVSDFTRLGAAQVSDLSDIRAVQIRFVVAASVNVSFSGLWIGGTYGPDTGRDLTPLIYRYRYRDSRTGAKSLPGPATRSGIQALRQGVVLTATASSDGQVDKIDFERLGADNLEWHYVGTASNSSPTLTDDQLSAAVLINPPLETDTYQPFPLADFPVTAIVNVIGTAVSRVSGDTFNTSWARGTVAIINGKATSLYASPASTSTLHIADSLGNATSAVLTINQPILQGQPLPVMWGPFKECIFGCGNTKATGTVYWTKANDPDSAPLQNMEEVTTPSEIMMNGCLYDSRCFCWSDKRFFFVTPGGPNKFQFTEIANGRGLLAPWAFCVGPKIWFLSQDGIYESDGGTPVNISNDIAPLFPSGDRAAYAAGGLYPVDTDLPGAGTQAQNLRLTYHSGFVFFDYIDTAGVNRCLVYDTIQKGWFPDRYFDQTGRGVNCRFSEMGREDSDEQYRLLCGGNDGFLYLAGGTSDDGIAIPVTGRTPAFDAGDQRALKVWGDLVADVAMSGVNLTLTPYTNNYSTALAASVVTNTARSLTDPIDLNSGSGEFGRNLGLQFYFATATEWPQLYFWSPSFVSRPENTFRRADDWSDAGYPGSKLVRGFLIEADTDSVVKGFDLDGDQTLIQSYSQTFGGQQLLAFSVTPPSVKSLLRIRPTSDVNWRKFRVSYIYEKYPESARIYTPYSNEGTPGAKFVQGALITAMGTDPACSVEYDGDQTHSETLSLSHPGTALSTRPYSFESPMVAHELRLAPSTAIRIADVKWIWEPAPEQAEYWETQETTHGMAGWQFLKDGYLAYMGGGFKLIITVDGVEYSYIYPGSGGPATYAKVYKLFTINTTNNRMLKGKVFKYRTEGMVRLFKKDCEFRVHSWTGDGYQIVRPFGGDSFVSGAEI